MPRASTAAARPRNRILAALPDEEYARIAPHLEPVTLQVRDLIHDIDQPITHVYFVNSGVASVVSIMADGNAVETATIGYEGMVGLAVFHHADRTAAQAFCQVAGDALRMPSDAFRSEIGHAPALQALLHRYTQALFTQVAQASACNRMHSIRQRCARWLLQTHDRVGSDDFAITHEFLAQMLGVRRASVSEVASALQQAGLIAYAYGRISIVSRPGLEQLSCECYFIIAREYDRLIEGRIRPSPLDGVVASKGTKSTLGAPEPRADADASE
ncbi:MAG TPA: Crp/Fnr family transcriptional regulator [Gemmatimonadaceae bacterium]|nr:Crp/Fnr family transcriptional regulator [Gemmatimonadaceae bacterium]